jgi:excisionase family DNA binding protein
MNDGQTMKQYSVHVELETTVYAAAEKLHEQLAAGDFHPSVGFSPRGWLDAQITLPAESLVQAAQIASAVLRDLTGLDAVAIEVMTEAEFDARQGFVTVPELLSVTEAAEELGVSRTRVQQLVDARQLEGTKVGNAVVIPRSSVEARKASTSASPLGTGEPARSAHA